MKNHLAFTIFVLIEVSVLAYIIFTTGSMPEKIASHFNSAGLPNGFMPQQGYLLFMLAFTVGIPTLVACSISIALRSNKTRIKIPNKEFWFSRKNNQDTIKVLNACMIWLGSLISIFMGYVHWLLIKANSVQPAQLPNNLLYLGMALFLISILIWVIFLSIRFMRVPKT
jgi:uncharacterized membrane protein YidH (DUF202 family)